MKLFVVFLFAALNFMSPLASAEVTEYGIVKWYNNTKGYGFIFPASLGADIFVHNRDVMNADGSLNEGDCVSFVKLKDEKFPGYFAINVLTVAPEFCDGHGTP